MTTTKVIVDYEHDSANLMPIYLAATSQPVPAFDAWQPAYRDTIDGRRVVWVKFDDLPAIFHVWLRDADGDRKIDARRAP